MIKFDYISMLSLSLLSKKSAKSRPSCTLNIAIAISISKPVLELIII